MSFMQLAWFLSVHLHVSIQQEIIVFGGYKQWSSKWIDILYISISKVRVGKKTKCGLGERIKRIRGPTAKCCCRSDKFAEEADSHWNLADVKPLLSAEDISKTKQMIHVSRKLYTAQTIARTLCLYGNNSHQIQSLRLIYVAY